MHTAQQLTPVTKVKTSYELITNWLDIGYTLNLSSNALQIMTILLRFYNPNKKFVFPLQETIAQRTNTSLATVKRGLNELLKKQLILKRRTNRGNVYGFTGKLFELLNSSNCTLPTAQFEPCIKEHDKEINKEQHAVVPLKNTSKERKPKEQGKNEGRTASTSFVSKGRITLDDVPQVVRDKARNPIAYWISLSREAKEQYLQEQKQLDKEEAKKEEFRKWQEAEKLKQEADRKAYEQLRQLPLNQQFSRETARSIVTKAMPLIRRGMKNKLAIDLCHAFNFSDLLEQIQAVQQCEK